MRWLRAQLARLERLLRRRRRVEALPAPLRFREAARLFRLQRPRASADEWEAFALQLACQAHDAGLARGFDRGRGVPPAEEERRHGWAASDGRPELVMALDGRDPRDPLRGVPPEERLEFADQIARAQRAGVQLHLELRPPGPTQHDRRP